MSDKRNYAKNPYAGKKEKLGINQQNRFQTSGRRSLLNLTKVHITAKGNGSVNMNMEKGYRMTLYLSRDSFFIICIFSGVTNQKISLLFREHGRRKK